MGKIKPAHARARMHGERFRQRDAGVLLRVEQIEQRPLFRVIGRRRITRRRTDAAIAFANQFLVRKLFRRRRNPTRCAPA